LKHGRVRVHFVSHRSSADVAIHKRLVSLAKSARNWLLVSSDRAVLAAGREAHAQVLSSEDFARHILDTIHNAQDPGLPNDELLSEAEVRKWEKIFQERRRENPD
jgi:hypothetical protein